MSHEKHCFFSLNFYIIEFIGRTILVCNRQYINYIKLVICQTLNKKKLLEYNIINSI